MDSTSSELMRRAVAGAHGQAALLARRQTGGRGRVGRSWHSYEGNLHLSVSFGLTNQRAAGHWSLLAAVALLDALRHVVPDQVVFSLKWPNDILICGRKLAGILLELAPAPQLHLVIGFGVNLAVAPPDLERPVICLAELGPVPERGAVAQALLANLSEWIERYEVLGFGPIREAWLAAAHRPGDPLTITQGSRRLDGTFADIAEDGALLLQCGNRQLKIAGGEVSAS